MSSAAEQPPPLMNGDEDPYKSKGRIEWKIENLTEFFREAVDSERLSAPVNVRGMPWKVSAMICENGQTAQQGRVGFYLEYQKSTDPPSWSCEAIAKLKILAQKKDAVDYVVVDRTFNFSAKEFAYSWGILERMTFEEIMSPDRGLYDEQTDSIVLAMDLSVEVTTDERGGGGRIAKYVLVAQNELTLDRVPTSFSTQIGNLQWQIHFDFDDQKKKEKGKLVVLSCKDMAKKARMGVDKVLLELFGYHRDDPKSAELYSPISEKSSVHRHLFTRKDNLLTVDIPGESAFNDLLFTCRMFKESSQLPDFTKPTTAVGRFSADVKLRVGDQQFHVNRQLLSTHSLFFDRMFHGDYTAATQQEVELSLNTHSAELFHDFLLVLCVNDALPNSMNVGALFKLADFYDAENVNKKCDQHLRMAREMPIEKRVLLARDHGSSETQALILNSVNFEQTKRISSLFMENR